MFYKKEITHTYGYCEEGVLLLLLGLGSFYEGIELICIFLYLGLLCGSFHGLIPLLRPLNLLENPYY